MRIGIVSLGCAKNLVDSELLLGLFKDPYFKYEKDNNKCDAIIINTCGFILSAKEESIETIFEIAELKKKKLKYLIVAGCLTQRYYDKLINEIKEVDLFIKIENINERIAHLERQYKYWEQEYWLTDAHNTMVRAEKEMAHIKAELVQLRAQLLPR